MQERWLLLCASLVLVVVGCGARSGDADAGPDAPADADSGLSADDAAANDADAYCVRLPSVPPTDPGIATCGGTACSLADGGVCCDDPVTGTGTCLQLTDRPCNAIQVKVCDETADCPAGSVCCVIYGAGSSTARETNNTCMPSCMGLAGRACKTDAECGPGHTCGSYRVNGYVVSTCAPPDPRCPG